MGEYSSNHTLPWTKNAATKGLLYFDTSRPMPFTVPTGVTPPPDTLGRKDMFPGLIPLRLTHGDRPFNITTSDMAIIKLDDKVIGGNDVLIKSATKEGIQDELILNWQYEVVDRAGKMANISQEELLRVYDMWRKPLRVSLSHEGISLQVAHTQKDVFYIKSPSHKSAQHVESNHALFGSGKHDEQYKYQYRHKPKGYKRNEFSLIAGLLPGNENLLLTYNIDYDSRLMSDKQFLSDVLTMPFDNPGYLRNYVRPILRIQKWG